MADREGACSTAPLSRATCAAWDAVDPLAEWRARFALPAGVIYLDGNSLGPLPRATADLIQDVVRRQWGEDLITSWNKHRWIDLPQRLGAKIARLLGAAAHEVIVADSISVNLFKLIAAALALRPGRRVVLSERGNFPTDLYVAQGLQDLLGERVELRLVEPDQLDAALDQDTALLMLTHVDYRTGRMHDMARLTAAAHDGGRAGALGPRAQRRRRAGGPHRSGRRSRGRMRLQVPERRSRRPGVPVSSPTAGRSRSGSRSPAGSATRGSLRSRRGISRRPASPGSSRAHRRS